MYIYAEPPDRSQLLADSAPGPNLRARKPHAYQSRSRDAVYDFETGRGTSGLAAIRGRGIHAGLPRKVETSGRQSHSALHPRFSRGLDPTDSRAQRKELRSGAREFPRNLRREPIFVWRVTLSPTEGAARIPTFETKRLYWTAGRTREDPPAVYESKNNLAE